MIEPKVLTRREYAAVVDVTDKLQDDILKETMTRMLGCIAEYRVVCHHLAPLLHDAVNAADDPQEKAHLQDLLESLKHGES